MCSHLLFDILEAFAGMDTLLQGTRREQPFNAAINVSTVWCSSYGYCLVT